MERSDFRRILTTLSSHGVDSVVVGGVAAALQGAPVTTFDLDLVHSREKPNLERLQAALVELNAYYRERPDLRLIPDPAKLGGEGHHLLHTRAGPLDLLGTVVTGESFAELRPHARVLNLGEGLSALVLDLEWIIRIKERLNRERDRASLPILKRTLQEREEGAK